MKFIIYSIVLIVALALQSIKLSAQEKYTVSGQIKSAKSGEEQIGVSVFFKETKSGTVTNAYGFYSITVPGGSYTMVISYMGYETIIKNLELKSTIKLDLELVETSNQLNEVIVKSTPEDDNVKSTEMSVNKLNITSIQKLPAFAGEVDIIKSIQLLPGVSTVGEGASGFNVRGGSVGQNLVVLDEAPVYQSSHMFGFFSVFNPDAVKDVKLYKGGIPAQYGGRLSSILDVRMKEGNNKEYDITGGVGTIFSRLAVEGPIKKDKSSFIIAARRSYADVLAKAFTNVLKDGGGLYFYDLTAKSNFNIDDKNKVYVSGYFGRDVFSLDKYQGFDWGNSTATVRWNHLYNSKLFSNYTLFYSNYDYGFKLGEDKNNNYDWKSKIITYNFKPKYTWFVNSKNEITFGAEAILYGFNPANAVSVSESVSSDISLEKRRAFETSLYFGNEQRISDKFSLQYGLRYSNFNYLGGTVYNYGDTIPGLKKPVLSTFQKDKWEPIKAFGNLEPRASFMYEVSNSVSIKASYNRMNQYIHLISNTTASTPIDVWQPSTNNIKPQQGNQVALGYFKNIKENGYETSAEVYYKWTKNQVDYIDGADLFINKYLEGQLLSGIGRAYGIELYAKKNTGRLTGWLSYTLGKSELKVDGINFGSNRFTGKGDWYATRFDQRHNFKLTSFYDLSKKVSLSGIFSYVSSAPATYPTDRVSQQGYVIPYFSGGKRNNVRIPDYHRLDVSATIKNIWRGKKERSGEDHLVISVYNAYARKNPFSVSFSQGKDRQPGDKPLSTTSTQTSIIGTIIPSISYNFKF
jgi:hypothetical protein